MQNFIVIAQDRSGTVARTSARTRPGTPAAAAAPALARYTERRNPGFEVMAVFCIHGDYTLEELDKMALPPQGALTEVFLFDEQEVFSC